MIFTGPDTPPVVTHKYPDGRITAYAWIRRCHITSTLGVVVENPATALYRIDYDPSRHHGEALPESTLVNDCFWPENAIPFGAYGTVVSPDRKMLYLYGMTGGGMHVTTSLARVEIDRLEHRDAYEYFVDGTWTRGMPNIGQPGTALVDANVGGQGNYFWSHPWQSYVWIGGDPFPGAEMYISTAPEPQGPWVQPQMFYTGPRGNHLLGAYSVQAHPSLTYGEKRNGMYLTYTKNDEPERGDIAGYTTPLIYVEFE